MYNITSELDKRYMIANRLPKIICPITPDNMIAIFSLIERPHIVNICKE